MLVGQYETKIGAKRRVAVPKVVRSHLGDKFIIARWYEGSLVLTDYKGWEKLMARLTSKVATITTTVRDTDRFVMGGAFEVEVDAQGRVIVPEVLVKHASLKSSAVFVGLSDRVEIWDKENWIKKEKEIAEYAGYLVESIAKSNA